MKFIGQFIQSLISRFRNDVYLEDVSSGTIASGGNLGLDSNNKIVKANVPTTHDAVTLAGTPDYITLSGQEITRNQIDLAADVTGTLPVGNGGTGATTLASNSILTGNGTSAVQAESTLSYDSEVLDIGADDNGAATIRRLRHTDEAGGELYIRGGDATGTDKAGGDLILFGGRSTSNASGGSVIIKTNPASGSSGSTLQSQNTVATFRADGDVLLTGNLIFEGPTPDAHETTFSITDPTADRTITVPNADVDLTKVRAATTSLDGVVELATTGEADTGTDTTRAVTPAGLKSHVDARYTNQIFSFTFSDLNYVSNTWTTPSQHGPTYYSWNNRHGSGQTQSASDAPSAVDSSSTISVDYLDQGAGIVIPVASKFVGFYGNIRVNNTSPNTARPVFGIFRATEPANDNNSDITATCISFDSYDTATGNRKNRFMKLENFPGTPVDLAQGDILFPAIGLDEASDGDILGSFTIVLRTLIP